MRLDAMASGWDILVKMASATGRLRVQETRGRFAFS